jgi:hypothetical protein
MLLLPLSTGQIRRKAPTDQRCKGFVGSYVFKIQDRQRSSVGAHPFIRRSSSGTSRFEAESKCGVSARELTTVHPQVYLTP